MTFKHLRDHLLTTTALVKGQRPREPSDSKPCIQVIPGVEHAGLSMIFMLRGRPMLPT